MLKITEQRGSEPDSMSLILEGRLAGPWVEELSGYWRKLSTNQQQCTIIDLTAVTFIDAEGKVLLACLWREGAELCASGCLTRCVVGEITGVGRVEQSCQHRENGIGEKTEDEM